MTGGEVGESGSRVTSSLSYHLRRKMSLRSQDYQSCDNAAAISSISRMFCHLGQINGGGSGRLYASNFLRVN